MESSTWFRLVPVSMQFPGAIARRSCHLKSARRVVVVVVVLVIAQGLSNAKSAVQTFHEILGRAKLKKYLVYM